jgi:hypothetical protein
MFLEYCRYRERGTDEVTEDVLVNKRRRLGWRLPRVVEIRDLPYGA